MLISVSADNKDVNLNQARNYLVTVLSFLSFQHASVLASTPVPSKRCKRVKTATDRVFKNIAIKDYRTTTTVS